MNPFEMIVIIVLVCVSGGVIGNWIKAREDRKERSHGSVKEADDLRDQIQTLEERIQVLERIVTDPSTREDLRRQFRDLER